MVSPEGRLRAMARLNGQPERRVVTRYALRNALGPDPGHRPDDAVPPRRDHHHRERLQLPGIGNKLVQAVSLQDVQEIGVIAMILAATTSSINIVADLAGDPRGAEAADEPVSGRLHMPRLTRTICREDRHRGARIRPRGRASWAARLTARDRHPDRSPGTPPSGGAPLGTDYLGRDVLSRVLHGGLSVIWIGAQRPCSPTGPG